MTRPATVDAFLISKKDLKNEYFSLIFSSSSVLSKCKPGQFVHVLLPGTDIYFRRAFSVASVSQEKNELEIIFKIFGRGTKIMAAMHKGAKINLLGPLGRPFGKVNKKKRVVIVAGGVGFPPLMFFAEDLIKKGHDPKKIEFFYGGRSNLDIVERNRIKKLGLNFRPATDDGSFGSKGLITKIVDDFINSYTGKEQLKMFGCGPEGMLKATDDLGLKHNIAGEISLEAPMPCGIGICLGCIVPLKNGKNSRVCCDGPIYQIGEVIL